MSFAYHAICRSADVLPLIGGFLHRRGPLTKLSGLGSAKLAPQARPSGPFRLHMERNGRA